MKEFDRYGAVEMDETVVTGFSEKKYQQLVLLTAAYMRLMLNPFCRKHFRPFFHLRKIILKKSTKEEKFWELFQTLIL